MSRITRWTGMAAAALALWAVAGREGQARITRDVGGIVSDNSGSGTYNNGVSNSSNSSRSNSRASSRSSLRNNSSSTDGNSGVYSNNSNSNRNSSNSSRNGQTNGQNNGQQAQTRAFGRTNTPTGKPLSGATVASAKGTSGTAVRKIGPPGSKGLGQSNAPSGAGFGMSGQIKEVTKSMVDSMRPMRVDYDPDQMSQKSGVIILNPRRYHASQEKAAQGTSTRRTDSMVQPL